MQRGKPENAIRSATRNVSMRNEKREIFHSAWESLEEMQAAGSPFGTKWIPEKSRLTMNVRSDIMSASPPARS